MSLKYIEIPELAMEFLGTFAIVFVGGIALMNADAGYIDLLGVAIANMLLLSVIIYIGLQISGAHYNPAITVSFILTKKINPIKGTYFIISQLLGSIIAALFINFIVSQALLDAAKDKSELGFPHLAIEYDAWRGVILELLLTFLLVFAFWRMVIDPPTSQVYGFVVGGVLGLSILVGGPLTGAALNPARVFGPALLTRDFADHWIFWIGPLLGGIIAGFVCYIFFENSNTS